MEPLDGQFHFEYLALLVARFAPISPPDGRLSSIPMAANSMQGMNAGCHLPTRVTPRVSEVQIGSWTFVWRVYFGSNTLSMTWITPLLHRMSVLTTLALSTITAPPAMLMVTDWPFTVLAEVRLTTCAASTFPGTT